MTEISVVIKGRREKKKRDFPLLNCIVEQSVLYEKAFKWNHSIFCF